MKKGRIITAVSATVALIGGFFVYLAYSDAQKQEEGKKLRQAHIQSQINLLDKEREDSILLQKERDAHYTNYANFLAESEKSLAARTDASEKMREKLAGQTVVTNLKSVYEDVWDCISGERVKYQRTRNQQDHTACTTDYTFETLGYEACVNKRRGSDASNLAEKVCRAAFRGNSVNSVMTIKANPN